MNEFWQFSLIMITLIPSGIFAGLKFKDYIENREKPAATNDLLKAIIFIALGLAVSIIILLLN